MPFSRNKYQAGAALLSAFILMGVLSACGKTETSASLVAQAKEFQAKGETKAAVIQLKNAIVKDAADKDARLALGLLYNETGDVLSAEKELRKAIELGADKAVALPALANALLRQRQFQNVLDQTASANMANAALLTVRGDAYAGLGDAAKARQSYEQALKVKAGHGAALIGLARLALGERDVERVGELIKQAVAANPADAEVFMFQGDLQRAQGQGAAAIASYEQALKIKPGHRSAHLEKAVVQISERKFDAAKRDIDSARKIAPNSVMVSYTQGLLDFSQGKHAAAKESLQAVLKVAPDHMPSVLLAGATEHALGSHSQAEQHLRKYLNAVPNHIHAKKLLASVLMKTNQNTEALATLAPMLAEAGDKDVQLLALVGEAHMQNRDFAKANEYFAKAITLEPKAAALRTSLALSRLAMGDNERAVADLEQSVKLDIASPKAATLLVMTEMRLKRFDKALAAAKALEAAQPNDPAVYNLLGGVYLGMKDEAKALASFEKALSIKPDFFPAVANLVQLAVRDKKPDIARQHLVKYLEKDKKHIDAMNGMAQLAAINGKPAEVTTWLEKASAENPDNAGAARVLGNHYLRTGDKQKALILARKFQVANPKDLDLLDLLGQAQLVNQDAAGALETYSKLVGQSPKSPMAHYRLAITHLQMKNAAAATESLKKAVALKEDFLEAQLAQVELAFRGNKPDEALAIARTVQKQRPTEAVGFALEGSLLQGMGKLDQAAGPFEKAFALAPSGASLVKLHGAMRAAGKTKEADARLAQWQKEHKPEAIVSLYVAESQLARKQFKDAIVSLENVTKLAPANPAGWNNLAWAYQQEKDPRAQKTAEHAFSLAPGSAAVIDTLGWILVEQGNMTRGMSMLQKAVTIAPEAPDIRLHLAMALAKSGDKGGARRELDKVKASKNFAENDDSRALAKQL